jgi:hypothetical protein
MLTFVVEEYNAGEFAVVVKPGNGLITVLPEKAQADELARAFNRITVDKSVLDGRRQLGIFTY